MPTRRTATLSSRALAALLAALLAACGAKTGLEVPDVDTAPDAAEDVRDVPVVFDAPMVIRPARCFPLRVRTRLGFVTNLRPDTDVSAADGYTWAVRRRPEGSRAMLFTDGSDIAVITPDRVGEYEVIVTIATPNAPNGRLECPITLIADPPDPACPGYALAEPRVVAIPNGSSQVGYDIVWGVPRTVSGSGTGAVLSDDVAARVAAYVSERATAAPVADPVMTVAAEGAVVEAALEGALGATAVLVGRTTTTHDGLPLRRTTLRLTDGGTGTTPGTLRDRALAADMGLSPPAEPPAPAHLPAQSFYIEVATIVRGSRVVHVVTVAPTGAFDDTAAQTAIRVEDLANATALAAAGTMVDVRCHAVTATRTVMADFVWLVDTSGSMDDDQERIGTAANRFFREMAEAGIDFRVGVFQAGSSPVNLSGFRWIDGADPGGALRMAHEVTDASYLNMESPNRRPFRIAGGEEEPLAASFLVSEAFNRQTTARMMRTPPMNAPPVIPPPMGVERPALVTFHEWRRDAARIVFLVTDEPGSNDVDRFFGRDQATWGLRSDDAALVRNIAGYYQRNTITPFGLVPNVTSARPCPNTPTLAACVITAAGGSFIPITTGSNPEGQRILDAALDRVVNTVAGQASEFVLPTTPISASLRVRVDTRFVPRSRADGMDYEGRARTLIFRGASYRPRVGQQVRAAYFVWPTTRP